ncbi:4-hydroxythreonine-4-phosphate dehydrogenase, partial [Pantoea sp. SIMBA_072]
LIIKIAQQPWSAAVAVCADKNLLKQRAEQLDLPITLHKYKKGEELPQHEPGHLWVEHIPVCEEVTPGELCIANGHYVV